MRRYCNDLSGQGELCFKSLLGFYGFVLPLLGQSFASLAGWIANSSQASNGSVPFSARDRETCSCSRACLLARTEKSNRKKPLIELTASYDQKMTPSAFSFSIFFGFFGSLYLFVGLGIRIMMTVEGDKKMRDNTRNLQIPTRKPNEAIM